MFTRNAALFQSENTHSVSNSAKTMSKKTPLTSNLLSKDVKILWVIDNKCLIQISPGSKPDWFLEMSY